ncbi:THxN family PEP-CTERM protein [Aliagarivorans taiwanensis]|uniref:THxN family PEP-CTERM protein n=1 Tax=Aliagarivorans taiwanensis TaxID=561966 RepID=UPI00047B2510|nr:THxN family PEP-CTERM protein [Aliagarivorans taiwanensis]
MNKLKLTCVAVSLGLAATAANADMISEFSYLNDAGFADYAPSATVTGTGDTNDLFDDSFNGAAAFFGAPADGVFEKSLAWGNPNNAQNAQSSLVVDDEATGVITTSTDEEALIWADGVGLTHNNFTVTGGGYLDTALLVDGLFLDTSVPATMPWDIAAPVLPFAVVFDETPNSGGVGGVCPYGGVSGDADNVGGCRDGFAVVIPDDAAITEAIDGDLVFATSLGVIGGDYEYTIFTRLSGIDIVPLAGDCDGLAVSCYGFLTVEGAINSLDAEFAILARAPEPGTLAVLGLGLLGLAGVRRRQA